MNVIVRQDLGEHLTFTKPHIPLTLQNISEEKEKGAQRIRDKRSCSFYNLCKVY